MSGFKREVDRRSFLRGAVAVGGGSALAPSFLQGLAARFTYAAETGKPLPQAGKGEGGYGPLQPAPDKNDGVVRVALPAGFSYGCWVGGRALFFNSTSGGNAELGQVWEYRPVGHHLGWLHLVFESPSIEVLSPRQHHRESQGRAGALRGRRRRDAILARPDARRTHLRLRRIPPQRARMGRGNIQPGWPDALREYPGRHQ